VTPPAIICSHAGEPALGGWSSDFLELLDPSGNSFINTSPSQSTLSPIPIAAASMPYSLPQLPAL
jgi:hypothetical protein